MPFRRHNLCNAFTRVADETTFPPPPTGVAASPRGPLTGSTIPDFPGPHPPAAEHKLLGEAIAISV
ncbi:hypothetical protein E2C01_037704 [Portunus trituberculatus]|uniref:Uncharacterized protein n=1 Tax=Portunus trituberculatus TaxID=210409 RepID=A0A5B7FHR1_PORTR|nr:hypothetical protein [Portunus trituberculatus]